MYKKILFADDLSNRALKAMKEALSLARCFKAELTILNVREDFLNKDEMVMLRVDVSHFQDDIKAKALAIKEKIRKDIITLDGDDVKTEIILREGKSRQNIVELAEELDADMLILGSHGTSLLKDKLFGSTAKSVIGNTKRSLLVVWTGE
ncbi:hypothetical protein CEE37_14235 [candidate division LCP-89 bacterium B3_LCP]|uniref:Universal stress protein n=1 Tax=candidate division LCP-89 bacterium B3_LCP TaxID=2012998 RepID=A0A532UQP9_UNCL8|nr:MAG: hypothetical protein CEE37_14235 [candidate division LCP-89 bacterium B3_LCP]